MTGAVPGRRAGDSHVILLTGPRGIGKTTCCGRVVGLLGARGAGVDGIVTVERVDRQGEPVQTVVDLRDGTRHDLARVGRSPEGDHGPVLDPAAVGVTGPTLTWRFDEAGLELGRRVLRRCRQSAAEVVVIDQIGPLELLAGGGWTEALEVARVRRPLTVLVVNEVVVDAVAARLRDREPLVVRVDVRDRDVLPRLLAELALGPWADRGDDARFAVLAADLDGTLLAATADGHGPVEGVTAALAALRAAGLRIVPCTGRSVTRTLEAARMLGLDDGLAVCFHGAVIADLADGRRVWRLDLPRDSAAAAVRLAGGRATAYVGDEVWEAAELERESPGAPLDPPRRWVTDLADALSQVDCTRLVLHPAAGTDVGRLSDAVATTCAGVRVGPAPGGRLAVHHAEAGKLAALRRLCAMIDAGADEVVAVGDDLDDAGVLAWAGLGICVGDASEAATAAADVIVPQSRLAPVLNALR